MPVNAPENKKSKVIPVREHPRRVPVSRKNPDGITIVDRHLRYIDGQYLDQKMIQEFFEKYDRKDIIYPSKDKLKLPNEDKYDDCIAVWTDYFNEKFKFKEPLDPDLIKALNAS